jgi:hypothetical protein
LAESQSNARIYRIHESCAIFNALNECGAINGFNKNEHIFDTKPKKSPSKMDAKRLIAPKLLPSKQRVASSSLAGRATFI